MKQVLQNLGNGETIVTDVPAPAVTSNRLIVQTRRSLISAGTEKMLVEFGQAGWIGKARAQPEKVRQVLDKIRTDGLMPTLDAVFSKLGEPLPLGYCNAGVVSAVGRGVTGFEIGDRVVSNGPHAEVVSVPPLLCAKIPDNVDDEQASFTVLASIGLQGIRLLEPTIGETVVVYGLGLIGLITVQLLRANGCRVIGIDINARRLELAQQFGAEVIHGVQCPDIAAKVSSLNNGRGADGVLITASAKTDEILSQSAKMCRKRGRVVLVGVVGLNMNRSDFFEKEISFQVSCSYGPGRYDEGYEQGGNDYPLGYVRWTEQRNFEAILQMLSANTICFTPLLSDSFDLDNAVDAYSKIQTDSSALGVVIKYLEQQNHSQTVTLAGGKAGPVAGDLVTAVIGAGNFTRATLMPVISKLPIQTKYIVGRTGGPAVQHLAQKFSVPLATTDFDSVLADSAVKLLMITTNHDSHAYLVCQGLEAGKHVFVEKPLGLTSEEISSVIDAVERNSQLHLAVGFNRRFSPHIDKCVELLNGRAEPVAINMLVNAGAIPANHWVHDSQKGGGRIIGEGCHFVDLAVKLCGSPVKSVSAHQMGTNAAIRSDKMTISLEMTDGSIVSIGYFANGSKSFPKERISIFSDERVLEIDNFRTTTGYGFKGFSRFKTSRQEKGHKQQFSMLCDSLSKGGSWLIGLDQLVNVSLATIAAAKSAELGRTILLADEYPTFFG